MSENEKSKKSKFYWLKLHDDFFEDLPIKLLRKLPEGDKLIIVYLKMQLKSLKSEGFIKYENILPSHIEELSVFIDEDPMIVGICVNALLQYKVIEQWDNDTLYLSAMQKSIGSESAAAERVRKWRSKKEDEKALHCNTGVTNSYTEKRREEKELREEKRDKRREEGNVSQRSCNVTQSDLSLNTDRFNEFWTLYPKKVSKTTALKAWNKLKIDDDLVRIILTSLEKQKKSAQWTKDNGQFIPNPTTWLNQERWEDELENTKNFNQESKYDYSSKESVI
jgi:predicted phage replisome organizer